MDRTTLDELLDQWNRALRDAQAWLADGTPDWIRDEVRVAIAATRPREVQG